MFPRREAIRDLYYYQKAEPSVEEGGQGQGQYIPYSRLTNAEKTRIEHGRDAIDQAANDGRSWRELGHAGRYWNGLGEPHTQASQVTDHEAEAEDEIIKAEAEAIAHKAWQQDLAEAGAHKLNDVHNHTKRTLSGFPTKVYHGTEHPGFEHFKPSDPGDYMPDRAVGVHLASDPEVANYIATGRKAIGGEQRMTGGVYPLNIPEGPYKEVNQPLLPYIENRYTAKTLNNITSDQSAIENMVSSSAYRQDPELFARHLKSSLNMKDDEANQLANDILSNKEVDNRLIGPRPINGLDDYIKSRGVTKPYDEQDRAKAVNLFRDEMQRKGYKGLRYINTSPMEARESGAKDPTSYVIFDPEKNIRGRYTGQNSHDRRMQQTATQETFQPAPIYMGEPNGSMQTANSYNGQKVKTNAEDNHDKPQEKTPEEVALLNKIASDGDACGRAYDRWEKGELTIDQYNEIFHNGHKLFRDDAYQLAALASRRGDQQTANEYLNMGQPRGLKCPGNCRDQGLPPGTLGHCDPTKEAQSQKTNGKNEPVILPITSDEENLLGEVYNDKAIYSHRYSTPGGMDGEAYWERQYSRLSRAIAMAEQRNDKAAAESYGKEMEFAKGESECPGGCIEQGLPTGSLGHCDPTKEIQSQSQQSNGRWRAGYVGTNISRGGNTPTEAVNRLPNLRQRSHETQFADRPQLMDLPIAQSTDDLAAQTNEQRAEAKKRSIFTHYGRQQETNAPAQSNVLPITATEDRLRSDLRESYVDFCAAQSKDRVRFDAGQARCRALIPQLVAMANQRGDAKAAAEYAGQLGGLEAWCPHDCEKQGLAPGSHGHCDTKEKKEEQKVFTHNGKPLPQFKEPDSLDHIANMPIAEDKHHAAKTNNAHQTNGMSAREQTLMQEAQAAWQTYWAPDGFALDEKGRKARAGNSQFADQQRARINELVELANARGDRKAATIYQGQGYWQCPGDCMREGLPLMSHGHCGPIADANGQPTITQKDAPTPAPQLQTKQQQEDREQFQNQFESHVPGEAFLGPDGRMVKNPCTIWSVPGPQNLTDKELATRPIDAAQMNPVELEQAKRRRGINAPPAPKEAPKQIEVRIEASSNGECPGDCVIQTLPRGSHGHCAPEPEQPVMRHSHSIPL